MAKTKDRKRDAARPARAERKQPSNITRKKKNTRRHNSGIDKMLGVTEDVENDNLDGSESSVQDKVEEGLPEPRSIHNSTSPDDTEYSRISISLRCRDDYVDRFETLYHQLSPQRKATARKNKVVVKQGQKVFTKSDLFEEALLLLFQQYEDEQ